MTKFVLKEEVKQKCKKNKHLMRLLEDCINRSKDSVRRLMDMNDERLVSKNVISIISITLNLTEEQILTKDIN